MERQEGEGSMAFSQFSLFADPFSSLALSPCYARPGVGETKGEDLDFKPSVGFLRLK